MFIALEGHSFSGKTTLLNYLHDEFHEAVIAEHDLYAGGVDNYPPFPATNEQMARASIDFFAKLEIQRTIDARKKHAERVFLDRSFLSVVLFQKFMRHLHIAGQADAYLYAKEKWIKLYEAERVIVPDIFAFISCETPELYRVRRSRSVSVAELKSDGALRFFTNEYEKIAKIYHSLGRSISLRSANSEQSLRENATALQQFAMKNSNLTTERRQQLFDRLTGIL